jgi:hypothetical protein
VVIDVHDCLSQPAFRFTRQKLALPSPPPSDLESHHARCSGMI